MLAGAKKNKIIIIKRRRRRRRRRRSFSWNNNSHLQLTSTTACPAAENAVFSVMWTKHLRSLQSVLNAAARVISRRSKYDQLQWLPIAQRIEYKLCLQITPPVRTEIPQWNVSIRLWHARPQKPALCSPRRSGRTKDKSINKRFTQFRRLCHENLEQFTVDHTRPLALRRTVQSASQTRSFL